MGMISLDEAKAYLRVDSADEDTLINGLLASAEGLCADVGRLSDDDWAEIIAPASDGDSRELTSRRAMLRVAVLYALGYLFEHREDADHLALTLTLRSLLFSMREGAG